jgi:preprotein translocase subunit SecA
MINIFSKLFDLNQKEIDRLSKVVDKVNDWEEKTKKLKDKDFTAKTIEFKKRFSDGEKLQDLLPEAFALVREASIRINDQRPFDVQIMASIALFEGKVAEQKTGEGKTLSAIPALYLHAISGEGSHLVTVNDYLARIGAGWMGPIFKLLGMNVGVIVQEGKSYIYDPEFEDKSHGDERLSHLRPVVRKEAYVSDITYGTNNEFGFDYLRDNMVQTLPEMVQRGHNFVIVDEVDSVLIDEARTPLIISMPDMDPTDKYYKFATMVEKLNPDTDYKIDEKSKSASLTEHGITRVEKILGVENLYEKDWDTIHHIENALRAKTLYLRDREYVVKDDQVTIVDEFTGRLMFGRRWSDGLHQAVEAKEQVKIQQESKTLATISFQNYFRMYKVLSGMTGTAATESEEFKKIYDLDVVVIPTHRDMVRNDRADVIYKTVSAKYGAVVSDIIERNKDGQPVLVGTTSIEKNEIISDYLKRKKVPHALLNAKNHEKEAAIISEAGRPGAVTVATNMAGRGVDIILGGASPDRPFVSDKPTKEEKILLKKFEKEMDIWKKEHDKVVKAGGLHVIGTERHESRRIDNQLRGRAGRQGDPGSSRFYLSLEDDLMRIFGGEQISGLMDRLKLPEDQPIENRLISRSIEQAQVKVEGFHFDSRKNLVEYDNVINQQREIIYKLRRRILDEKDLKVEVQDKLTHQTDKIMLFGTDVESGNIDEEKVVVSLMEIVPFDDASMSRIKEQLEKFKENTEKVKDFMQKMITDIYESREKQQGSEVMRNIEKFAYLGAIDKHWIDHIDQLDGLREAVRLRGYGQRDPVVDFKNEAFTLFESLIDRIDDELARRIFRIGVAQAPRPEVPLDLATTNVDPTDSTGLIDKSREKLEGIKEEPAFVEASVGRPAFAQSSSGNPISSTASGGNQPSSKKKIGRNDTCPCGSGKKYKKCHYPQYG